MILGVDASRAARARRTGTEAYAFYLIQSLIPLARQRGHQLRLYFNQPPAPGLFPLGAGVEHLILPFPRLWTHLRLAWQLHRRPPHVFFTPAHVIPLTYHGRSAATVHDCGYHHFPEAHPPRQRAYLRWSTRHNARRARLVLADSRATKADLIRFDGIDPAKIEVVYPGVDPELAPVREESQITAVLRKYQITPPYFLFLSTLQPRKNLIRLVRAYTASGVPHQLVLAGKPGWLSAPIVDEVNRQSSIALTGFVADADKAALLSGATALLYPSLYEGFGFPVLEAQVCETAVLTATTSSLPEVAGAGALLVDPLDEAAIADGIRRLASDRALRHDLIAKGRVNVAKFTWQKTAVRVLNLLEMNR